MTNCGQMVYAKVYGRFIQQTFISDIQDDPNSLKGTARESPESGF
jgi:hypothetical protein